MSRIDFQNQAQTLMEELEFLRRLHETVNVVLNLHFTHDSFMRLLLQEMKELQTLLSKEPLDTREFFKNELALAIGDIRSEYGLIAESNKTDMETWYKLKV